jgi:hypothetical protein
MGKERRLKGLIERKSMLESKHKGNEERFTYHGGYELGYIKGKITELEDSVDVSKELVDALQDLMNNHSFSGQEQALRQKCQQAINKACNKG